MIVKFGLDINVTGLITADEIHLELDIHVPQEWVTIGV
jgi:hypothetical protein